MVLLGDTLYGTGAVMGVYSAKVFKISTDGSDYTVLKKFDHDAGPRGPLIVYNTTLFGTTAGGGSRNGAGTVFQINTDGSGYAEVKSFSEPVMSAAGGLFNGVILSNSTLFGTAFGGGSSNQGTVFRVNIDGSGFTVLKDFKGGSDGGEPMGGLVLSGSTLYGTTFYSYPVVGTIFKINTDGSGYAILKSFTGRDGLQPQGTMVLLGSTL